MKPVAGYVRVSTQKQSDEGISLEMQADAIARYCAAMGLPDPLMYRDAGISAYKEHLAHRPAFARLLADAERGAVGTIVVASLDRWSRKLRTIDDTLHRLDRAGVALISLREHLDYSTAVGKLTINMLGAIAQHTSDDRSEGSKRTHAELRAQGKWSGGSPPFGALRDSDGFLQLDPTKAAALARLLELVATTSHYQAAEALNAEGYPPPGAYRKPKAGHAHTGLWSAHGAYLVVARGAWLLRQPAPWPERYLAAASRPRQPSVAWGRTTRILTALTRCGACGGAVVYAVDNRPGHQPRLRCERQGCRAYYGLAAPHEAWVLAAVAKLRQREHLAPPPGIDGRAYALLADDRLRIATLYKDRHLSHQEYQAANAEFARREAILTASSAPVRDFAGIATVLPHLATGEPADINETLRELIASIVLTGKQTRRIVWRPATTVAFAGCE